MIGGDSGEQCQGRSGEVPGEQHTGLNTLAGDGCVDDRVVLEPSESEEVEEVLLRHPAVVEAAVIGVPDADWGESICAVVVLESGTEASGADLITHCRNRLASFKKPRSVVFTDELPKNATGKVLKRELRARAGPGTDA